MSLREGGCALSQMGSSQAAGTRGRPATPRDGTAVELAALAWSCAAWLAGAHAAGLYPHAGLARRHPAAATAYTWRQWADRLKANFERHFWVGAPPAAVARPDLVHRTNIYKGACLYRRHAAYRYGIAVGYIHLGPYL